MPTWCRSACLRSQCPPAHIAWCEVCSWKSSMCSHVAPLILATHVALHARGASRVCCCHARRTALEMTCQVLAGQGRLVSLFWFTRLLHGA